MLDKIRMIFPIALAVVLIASATATTAADDTSDLRTDTWTATDALGRTVPGFADVGPPRPGKTVGIFYFLWLGQSGDLGPFDVSKILAQDPSALANPASPLWGPMYSPHHWGESIFGYYVSEDESVLRKHAQMLSNAGVDAVFFDVTNQVTYPKSWKALCRVFDQVKREGNRAPQIAFLCPFGEPRKVVRELWDDLYSKNLYPDLWFRWEGKPLILADPTVPIDAVERRPGIKTTDALLHFPQAPARLLRWADRAEQWSWLEVYPQHAFYMREGVPEQVSVGVAENAVDGKLGVLSNPRSYGRSFHDGREPGRTARMGRGRTSPSNGNARLEIDPPLVWVTGWNEWIAGRFDSTFPLAGSGPVTFCDEFNQEYSRDIEPMKGGHGDNYYYQLVASIRRYKGVRPIASVESRPIQVDGRFDDWTAVQPEFRDTIGDPVHRDHAGWGKQLHYRNTTGRNDIVAAKLSFDRANACFYTRTRENLTPETDANWMLLFIDADHNPRTGWLGYDFVVNRRARGRARRRSRRTSAASMSGVSSGEVAIRQRIEGARTRRTVLGLRYLRRSRQCSTSSGPTTFSRPATGPTSRSTATPRRTIGSTIGR